MSNRFCLDLSSFRLNIGTIMFAPCSILGRFGSVSVGHELVLTRFASDAVRLGLDFVGGWFASTRVHIPIRFGSSFRCTKRRMRSLGTLVWGVPRIGESVFVLISVSVWVGRGWVAAARRDPPHGDPPHRNRTGQYCTVLYSTAQYCTVLHSTALY